MHQKFENLWPRWCQQTGSLFQMLIKDYDWLKKVDLSFTFTTFLNLTVQYNLDQTIERQANEKLNHPRFKKTLLSLAIKTTAIPVKVALLAEINLVCLRLMSQWVTEALKWPCQGKSGTQTICQNFAVGNTSTGLNGGEGRYCKRTQGHPSPFYEDLTLLTVSSDGWQTATSLRRPKSQLAATSTESPWFINYITWAVEISHHSWGIFFLNSFLKANTAGFASLGTQRLVWTTFLFEANLLFSSLFTSLFFLFPSLAS